MSDDPTGTATLTYLLSSTSYTLAYTLPLICLSFVLTFAGTFLMLDRSRSFPPRNDYTSLPGTFDKPRKHAFTWALEGGVGGLACGYLTGLHLATFLSLIIPATTSSTNLSSKSFLAIWVLVCILTTLLSGRYRYAALVCSGLSGGALTSLALCVILHPSLAPRIILMAVLVPLMMILVLVFYFVPKFHFWLLHPTLRLCTASTGAFGIVLSISILLKPRSEAWVNVWERLSLRDGASWGTGQEKGLSAAYAVFLILGMVSDWVLHKWFGECPDEKWDNYLANYTANLPIQPDRAGTFEPRKSFWDRVLSRNANADPILFPSDKDMKSPYPHTVELETPSPLAVGHLKKPPIRLQKHHLNLSSRKRKPVKFGAVDDVSSSEEESGFKSSPLLALPPLSYSSSTPTLVDEPPRGFIKKHDSKKAPDNTKPVDIDYDVELSVLRKLKGNDIDVMLADYSDVEEEDLTSISQRRQANGNAGPWSPAFMKRHSDSVHDAESSVGTVPVPPPGAMPVPATPSLIKALDRIAVAQKEAFGTGVTSPTGAGLNVVSTAIPEEAEDNLHTIEQERKERAPRWEEFWHEVRNKARN